MPRGAGEGSSALKLESDSHWECDASSGAVSPQFQDTNAGTYGGDTAELYRLPRRTATVAQQGPRLIAIGGGKGGIGKSFISANIGIALARQGFRVALVDLDFGAANLHTCLGVNRPKADLFDFINNKVENLEDIATQTTVPNLILFGGGQEFWQQVRPHSAQKIRIISRLQKLDVDYVIMDLAAGTHTTTQDFFIFSHMGIVVVVPEPTSIENAYVFLKGVLCRRLETIVKSIRKEEAAAELLRSLQENPKSSMPPFLKLQEFAARDPEVGARVLELIQRSQIGIVVNQTRTKSDVDIGQSMKIICGRYFGFSAEFLGPTSYDDSVWKSVRARRPLHADYPESNALLDLKELTKNLVAIQPPSANVKQKSV
jgi:flagellar biosynthesis protein FlhG